MTLIKFSKEMPASRTRMFPVFNELFNDLFENSLSTDFRRWTSPAVNIVSYDDKYELHVAAPGLSKDDLKINIEGDRLTISGEKESSSNETKGNYTRREFHLNSFSRSFTLPEEVNVDAIEAKFENGMTVVSLPKHVEVKVKSREIKLS